MELLRYVIAYVLSVYNVHIPLLLSSIVMLLICSSFEIQCLRNDLIFIQRKMIHIILFHSENLQQKNQEGGLYII